MSASHSGLEALLRSRIKGKVAVVGIGNIMRGDDGLGPKLTEILKSKKAVFPVFDCGTAPENYIFPILSTSCDTVILVDAADIKLPPGTIKIFGMEEISKVSFSTHSPSPRLFTDLLVTGKENMNIFVISIQPRTTALGESLSEEVMRAVEELAGLLIKAC